MQKLKKTHLDFPVNRTTENEQISKPLKEFEHESKFFKQ